MPSPLVDEAIVKPCDVLGGKYRVERVLGMGGMGIVVAARHVDLRTRLALKIMRPDTGRDPESVERFLREARAAVQLKSEHCVQVVDVGRLENGSPYMVMEFLVGRDLGELVAREGARSPAEAVDYVLQACAGVAEAHARGIIHRDLKPQNLFVTKRLDGTPLVKVLDFGLAKSLSTTKEMRALTQTTAVMGSPVYMSPEQMRASRTVDVRSDTWSLGVCLHELLTGRPPFEGATFPELCSMVLNDAPSPMPSDIPRGLAKIVARCLEKDPKRRFANVADLAEALEEFAAARGVADRIRAVLAAPRAELESLPLPLRADPDAETRSATAIDTLRRPRAPRSRWTALAVGLVTFVTVGTIAMMAFVTHPPSRSSAPPSTPRPADPSAVAPTLPAADLPYLPGLPGLPGEANPQTAATSATSPPGSAAVSTESASFKRGHVHTGFLRHASAPAQPTPPTAPPPAATAPVLKPKTTEF